MENTPYQLSDQDYRDLLRLLPKLAQEAAARASYFDPRDEPGMRVMWDELALNAAECRRSLYAFGVVAGYIDQAGKVAQ